jgi:hypothetical protein
VGPNGGAASAEGRNEAVGVDRETGPLPTGITEVWALRKAHPVPEHHD